MASAHQGIHARTIIINVRVSRASAHQGIHARTIIINVRVSRVSAHQGIHVQTRITFVFREHTCRGCDPSHYADYEHDKQWLFQWAQKALFTESVGTRAKISGFFARVPAGAKCRKHWQAWVIWLSASFWRALTPDWAVLSREYGNIQYGDYKPYMNNSLMP